MPDKDEKKANDVKRATHYFEIFKALILMIAGGFLIYIAIRTYDEGVAINNDLYYKFGEEGVLIGSLGFGLIFMLVGFKMTWKAIQKLRKK